MSRFASIKASQGPRQSPVDPEETKASPAVSSKSGAREGKKVVSGHFSPEMSRALHILALEEETTLQALMGEAFDDLMRKYGRHPFGER